MDIGTSIVIGVVVGMVVGGINAVYWAKISRRQAEEEKHRTQMFCQLFENDKATISLAEATAKAVRDGHCNGEMSRALEYAQEVKHRQEQLLREQAASSM